MSYCTGNSKSVAAKLLESPQAVKMDNLTVTRLRTECRLRRLPVSGRKRNLVLRLLPFAEAILNESGSSESTEASAGVTHVLARPPTMNDERPSQPIQSTTTQAEFHPPFVSLDSFISNWSNVDGEDWVVDGRADALTAADNTRSSIINHVDVLTRTGTEPHHGGAHPPPSDANVDGDEGESLVCRWLRQQRLIDQLRRELCHYRRALAAARLQTLARSSVDGGDDPTSSVRLFNDIGVCIDDEISRYQPALSYFTAKRYA